MLGQFALFETLIGVGGLASFGEFFDKNVLGRFALAIHYPVVKGAVDCAGMKAMAAKLVAFSKEVSWKEENWRVIKQTTTSDQPSRGLLPLREAI